MEKHYASESQVWLIIYKKDYCHLGLGLDEAVEEALCFGWIDSTLRSLDERCYAHRFSPRRQNSIWSVSNIKRVEKLIVEGKMTPVGMQKIEEAKANGEWGAAIRREQVDRIPADLEVALRKVDGALDAYQALPASRKKNYIYWLQTAKRAETKERRVRKIVEEVLSK